MTNSRLYQMSFAKIYPLYVQKVERRGQGIADLNKIIEWLTGYDATTIQSKIDQDVDLENFFEAAMIHPNAQLITGVICGVRVENIEDPLMQKIRYLDKLVDELAKGKAMTKILRS